MDNKKLGLILLIISIIIGVLLSGFMDELRKTSEEIGCYQNEECSDIESLFTLSHISIGAIAAIFSLAIYLIIFTKGEEAIVKTLEESKNKSLKQEKFNILLKALDQYERNVLKAIKDQPGITQSTLRLRTNLSKTKLSYVVNELEKRKLIKRIKKKKTYAIFMIENI